VPAFALWIMLISAVGIKVLMQGQAVE
jgi:hypothetical protein